MALLDEQSMETLFEKKRHVFCGSAHNNNHTLEIENQIKLFIRFLLRKAIKYQDIVGYMKYSIYCLFPIYYWLVNPVIFYSISPFDGRGVRILFVNCSRKLIFLARSRRCCALRLSIMVETEASDSFFVLTKDVDSFILGAMNPRREIILSASAVFMCWRGWLLKKYFLEMRM